MAKSTTMSPALKAHIAVLSEIKRRLEAKRAKEQAEKRASRESQRRKRLYVKRRTRAHRGSPGTIQDSKFYRGSRRTSRSKARRTSRR